MGRNNAQMNQTGKNSKKYNNQDKGEAGKNQASKSSNLQNVVYKRGAKRFNQGTYNNLVTSGPNKMLF